VVENQETQAHEEIETGKRQHMRGGTNPEKVPQLEKLKRDGGGGVRKSFCRRQGKPEAKLLTARVG